MVFMKTEGKINIVLESNEIPHVWRVFQIWHELFQNNQPLEVGKIYNEEINDILIDKIHSLLWHASCCINSTNEFNKKTDDKLDKLDNELEGLVKPLAQKTIEALEEDHRVICKPFKDAYEAFKDWSRTPNKEFVIESTTCTKIVLKYCPFCGKVL